nr:hypothetical protein [uncultured Hyphomonas sp.]
MIGLTAIIAVAPIAIAGTPNQAPAETWTSYTEFNWPEEPKTALPDARLNDRLAAARKAYAIAKQAAKQAEVDYRKFENVADYSTRREVISEEIVFDGTPVENATGQYMAGAIEYPSGAVATGLFYFITYPTNSVWGSVKVAGGKHNRIKSFIGELRHPGTINVLPGDGIAVYAGGDTFTGTYYGVGGGYGVYKKYDGSRRFTGILKDLNGRLQPENGIVQDQDGNLVAVVFSGP